MRGQLTISHRLSIAGDLLDRHKLTVLVVEDNEIDVMCFRRSFDSCADTNQVLVAENGLVALQMLRGENGYPKVPRPYLIFLDINMPTMTGLEFLAELRRDPALSGSIVFVLTTSDDTSDIQQAYGFNVAGYILKDVLGGPQQKLCQLVQSYHEMVAFPMLN